MNDPKHDQNYTTSNFSISLMINSSCTSLITEETNKFKFGFLHSFVDKNKHVQKHLAVNFGSLVGKITDNLDCSKLADFHKFFD